MTSDDHLDTRHRHFPTEHRQVSSRGQKAIWTYMGCPWLADVWPAEDGDVRAAAEGSNDSRENPLAPETKRAMGSER